MRGYTLPVWLAAAARAALMALRGDPFEGVPELELLGEEGRRPVPVRSAARIGEGWALGVCRCDPGDGLDLTRGLEVWALLRWREDGAARNAAADPPDPHDWLTIEPGEGVGIHAASGEACLSAYALELLAANLQPLLPPQRGLTLRIVLPEGRRLAERTSNAAFGVVDGLALIGTQAEVQAGASPDQLATSLAQLETQTSAPGFAGDLVLVIGENGLDLAPRLGLPPGLLLKAGNWLGPVLVAAAERGVRRLLLFGYQGKLIKLAAGIFHTHHHLADGRAEVLTALAALEGLTGERLQALHAAATVEEALLALQEWDPGAAERLRQRIAATVERRSSAYLQRHGAPAMVVGAALFDRARRLCACGPRGVELLEAFRQPP